MASKNKFTLRAMKPSDSEAVNRLISNFDGQIVTHFQVDAYNAIVSGTKHHTIGVVVESAGYDGLVGMGTMRYSTVQFNGELLPHAFLDGLKVHPDFRRQGLGYKIANWRVQEARKLYGNKCVIGTGMEINNHASRAVAKKWCREFIEPAFEINIRQARKRPPKSMEGITVREIELNEFEEFATRYNIFYKDYNLYEPGNAESIKSALDIEVGDRKPYRCYVAVDSQGNLLAGAQTWARGILKSDMLIDPPTPLRILNKFIHLIPKDFKIRDVAVEGIWYKTDQIRAAQFLWESIRWLGRDQGNSFVIGFDPKDPVQKVVQMKPWHQPRPKIRLALHGPAPSDREKTLFGFGRV